jgi:hypothetical protein
MKTNTLVSAYHIKKWQDEKKALGLVIETASKLKSRGWKWDGKNPKNDIMAGYHLWYREIGTFSKQKPGPDMKVTIHRIAPSWIFYFKTHSDHPKEEAEMEKIIQEEFKDCVGSDLCEKLNDIFISKHGPKPTAKHAAPKGAQMSYLDDFMVIRDGMRYHLFGTSAMPELVSKITDIHFDMDKLTEYRDKVSSAWFNNLDSVKDLFKFRGKYLMVGKDVNLSDRLLDQLREISSRFYLLRDESAICHRYVNEIVWLYFMMNLSKITEKEIKGKAGIMQAYKTEAEDKKNFINDTDVSVNFVDDLIKEMSSELNVSMNQKKSQKMDMMNLLLKAIAVLFLVSIGLFYASTFL